MKIQNIREHVERWVRKIRVRQCSVPFVVFFRERSGSTYLCSLLDSHRQISCREEDFHGVFVGGVDNLKKRQDLNNWARRINLYGGSKKINPSKKDVISHLYNIYSNHSFACGFKFKYSRQFRLFSEVLDEFKHLRYLRIIVLKRENVLKQAVSRQNLTNVRAVSGHANLMTCEEKKLGKFKLDIESVLAYARGAEKENEQFMVETNQLIERLGRPSLHVKYENLLRDREKEMRTVFDFLNVHSSIDIDNTKVSKATPDCLADAITNYDELVRAVQGTNYISMID